MEHKAASSTSYTDGVSPVSSSFPEHPGISLVAQRTFLLSLLGSGETMRFFLNERVRACVFPFPR